LNVYPQVPAVLQELRDSGVRLGIVSNVGQEAEEDVRRALEEGQIYDLFEPSLLIYGEKDSPEIFRRAAEQAGNSATPERCLYVGEDRYERSYALEAGFRVAPHPRLALEVLNGKHLRYIRVTVPAEYRSRGGWREAIRDLSVVPIHVSGENGTTVYAIATSGAASRLDDLGFEVDRLGSEDLPLATPVQGEGSGRDEAPPLCGNPGQSGRGYPPNRRRQNPRPRSSRNSSSSRSALYISFRNPVTSFSQKSCCVSSH
jgi:bacterial leucyl aminopeptidase